MTWHPLMQLAERFKLEAGKYCEICHIAGEQRMTIVNCGGCDQRIVRTCGEVFWQRCKHACVGSAHG